MDTRIERDSMGELEVPAKALYGAQTSVPLIIFPSQARPCRWHLCMPWHALS